MSTRLNTPQLQQSFHLFVINSTRKVMCNGLVVVAVVVSVAAEHLQFFFYSVIRSRPVVPVTPSGRHGELSAQSIGRFAAAQRVTIPAWWWQQSWWCAVSVHRRGAHLCTG